jgi:hypothetical protein
VLPQRTGAPHHPCDGSAKGHYWSRC